MHISSISWERPRKLEILALWGTEIWSMWGIGLQEPMSFVDRLKFLLTSLDPCDVQGVGKREKINFFKILVGAKQQTPKYPND